MAHYIGKYRIVKAGLNNRPTYRGYIIESRKVMEDFLERQLQKNECIHHINGKEDDNRIENLQIVSRGEHMTIHKKGFKKLRTHKDLLIDLYQNKKWSLRKIQKEYGFNRDTIARLLKEYIKLRPVGCQKGWQHESGYSRH